MTNKYNELFNLIKSNNWDKLEQKLNFYYKNIDKEFFDPNIKDDNNNYLLTIEPRGQLEVDEILKRSCEIIKYKLNLIKDKIGKDKIIDDGNGIIILNNEDHTIGNLLTYRLQENKDIILAGYELEHLLIKDVKIKYNIKNGKLINDVLDKEINYLIKYYDNLGKEFSKLKLKNNLNKKV